MASARARGRQGKAQGEGEGKEDEVEVDVRGGARLVKDQEVLALMLLATLHVQAGNRLLALRHAAHAARKAESLCGRYARLEAPLLASPRPLSLSLSLSLTPASECLLPPHSWNESEQGRICACVGHRACASCASCAAHGMSAACGAYQFITCLAPTARIPLLLQST